MPVSTHLAPEAESTSPSLSGVSTPVDSAIGAMGYSGIKSLTNR
jgi:hypothetical protein